jgi:hypothetical protein
MRPNPYAWLEERMDFLARIGVIAVDRRSGGCLQQLGPAKK